MNYQSGGGSGSSSGGGGLKKPSIEIAGGKLEPASLPFGAKGVKWTKDFAKGGKASSASKRADGCAIKGKTRGKMV